jgi:predicted RNA methylase
MKYQNIREEELKNKVAQDYFGRYDCTKIIGNVDFCVCMHQSPKELFEQEFLLWAEAKKGSSDIYKSIVQLILTIGKARTFDKFLPPAMLGAFDGEKIAFIPYNDIHEVFYINDFNWNVTPSNYDTKEFKLIHEKVKTVIDNKALLFNFLNDDRELKKFIKKNFIVDKFGLTKTKIDKNNFMVIYNKWLQAVKPTIAVKWDIAKKTGIIDGDFYLADLLSQENNTLKEKLFVLLRHDHYELDRKLDEAGMFSSKRTEFTDKQVAHTQFWNKYDRPPKEEYWDYIVERRDLLVPQDIRERKGSFFTPQIWVELSQKYLTDVLGEDWQDEYYVWDCAAGTGNLLAGLTNKYNVWASTLDKQDVEVIHDRINNGANLLHDHVFQFDFLNDDFSKLPRPLQEIINNPEKRKKLVVYINPPYAEATSSKTISNADSKHKKSVATSRTKEKYESILNQASKELFVQFLYRAYVEIEGCYIGNFSKVKILQGNHYKEFRENFHAKLERLFIVPSYTFDNVTGKFPIGFFIWNTQVNSPFQNVNADVYELDTTCIGHKNMFVPPNKNIKDWLRQYNTTSNESIAY